MNSIADFNPGDIATIIGFTGGMELQSRLVEMGFIAGIGALAEILETECGALFKYADMKADAELKRQEE